MVDLRATNLAEEFGERQTPIASEGPGHARGRSDKADGGTYAHRDDYGDHSCGSGDRVGGLGENFDERVFGWGVLFER